jgi:hypothetical protein
VCRRSPGMHRFVGTRMNSIYVEALDDFYWSEGQVEDRNQTLDR